MTDPFIISHFTPDYIKMFVDRFKRAASIVRGILSTCTVICLAVPPCVKSHLYSSACTLAVSSITVRSSSLKPVNIHLISAPTLPQPLKGKVIAVYGLLKVKLYSSASCFAAIFFYAFRCTVARNSLCLITYFLVANPTNML